MIEVGPTERRKAAAVIENLLLTLQIKVSDIAGRSHIPAPYIYSMRKQYKKPSGLYHCPDKWVKKFLAWGEQP